MDGIHIPREVADAASVPQDLDASVAGQYRFPDPRRRRIAGVIYVGLAIVIAVVIQDSPERWLASAGALLLAIWHFAAAWPLNVSAEDALTTAAVDAPFVIGHASAAVTFHGWRGRPRWHVVLYDASEPPGERALIVLDGVTGVRVAEPYVEAVPTAE